MFTLPENRVCVMGIVNVTPDSFSDGGLFPGPEEALAKAIRLHADGADIVDVGGESTRPGAEPVDEAEEARRALPVVEGLALRGIPASIDTSKPRIARDAIMLGAGVVNDVTGLRNEEMVRVVADSDATVCIMHMLGEPRTMQQSPVYADVVSEVRQFLNEAALRAQAGGIGRDRIWVDPGIGFGKNLEDNLRLLAGLHSIAELGYPTLVGVSRKSFIGRIGGIEKPSERLGGSLAAALFAAQRGARVVRVHDVRQTVEALQVWRELSLAD